MSKTVTQIFDEVAEAIQEKTGDDTPIAAKDFGNKIKDIKANDWGYITLDGHESVYFNLKALKDNLPAELLNEKLYQPVIEDGIDMGISFAHYTFIHTNSSEEFGDCQIIIRNTWPDSDSAFCLSTISLGNNYNSIDNDIAVVKVKDISSPETLTFGELIDLFIADLGNPSYEIIGDSSVDSETTNIFATNIRVFSGQYWDNRQYSIMPTGIDFTALQTIISK